MSYEDCRAAAYTANVNAGQVAGYLNSQMRNEAQETVKAARRIEATNRPQKYWSEQLKRWITAEQGGH